MPIKLSQAKLSYTAVSLQSDLPEVIDVTGGEIDQTAGACAVVRHSVCEGLDGNFPRRDVLRCLDTYDLILPQDVSQRELVLADFFEFLHGRYESAIEPKRNICNIERLIGLIVEARPLSRLPILDLGCGPGLSTEVGRNAGARLVGFDICEGMKRLAEERGMQTVDAGAIASWPKSSLRGCFASYVLHLHQRPEVLFDVWRCIEPGGVFAANFHKGLGLDAFIEYASRLGMTVAQIDESGQNDPHGLYVYCQKD